MSRLNVTHSKSIISHPRSEATTGRGSGETLLLRRDYELQVEGYRPRANPVRLQSNDLILVVPVVFAKITSSAHSFQLAGVPPL